MTAKNTIRKIVALTCMLGVIGWTNAPLVSAYQAHLLSVTANIVDDTVTITPSGENFCNDGSLKVELKTALPDAAIYYTTDGSNPTCGNNGTLYAGAFALSGSKTVMAVSCHAGLQSLATKRNFNVSYDYCDKSTLKINKIFANVDASHGSDPANEWVEVYNPTSQPVDIKDWKLCDAQDCDILAGGSLIIPNKSYAVFTANASTWDYWNIGGKAMQITLGSVIGDGLGNDSDTLTLKDGHGTVVDEISWGNSGFSAPAKGAIKGRLSNGYDTDSAKDWITYELPKVKVTSPNGGEIWTAGLDETVTWTATNASGTPVSGYAIDIYYSNDSGATWATVVRNTENDGTYRFRLPLYFEVDGKKYMTNGEHARIKVVATDYATNFMISNSDMSDADFCPPVDMSLLTDAEKDYLKTIDTSGIKFINNGEVLAQTAQDTTGSTGTNSNDTETKTTEILNKDNKEYLLGENKEEADDNGASDAGNDIATETAAPATIETATESTPAPAVVEQQTPAPESAPAVTPAAAETTEKAADCADCITPDADATLEFNLNA